MSSEILMTLKNQSVKHLIQQDFRQTLDFQLCECVSSVTFMQYRHSALLCMFWLIRALCVKEQEKLLAQRKVPGLQTQLEEYKSALCQLQAQKQRLQTEVGPMVTMTARGYHRANTYKKKH